MKERLSSIQIQLLNRLSTLKEPVSSQFLANSLGVSSKTIRNNLKELDEYLKTRGASIESKTGSGYWLVINDRDQFDLLIQPKAPASLRHIINPIQVDRTHLIIRHLLSKEGYTKIEELDDLLFMNRTSVKQNINRAKEVLDQFDLKITSKSRHGLKIIGSEHDIRLCLNYEYGNLKTTSIRTAKLEEYERLYLFDEEILKQIEKSIRTLQKTFISYNLSAYSVSVLARLIMISAVRNKMGYFLKYPEATIVKFTNRNSYYVSKLILNQCSDLLKTEFTREDVVLLAIGFVGFRISLSPDEMYRDGFLESRDIAFDLVQYLAVKNDFRSINKDIKLVEDIALHLDGLFTRSSYHLKTTQFASEVQVNCSLMSRKLAMQAFVYLNEKYGIQIHEEEVIRLAMVIHPVFGRFPWHFKKVKACCVSNIDKSVARGVAERLMRNFNRFIEQIDVMEYYELFEKDLSAYSILFTSYPKDELLFLSKEIQIIEAGLFMNEIDKERIRNQFVNRAPDNVAQMSAFLRPQHIYNNIDASNRDECIHEISHCLSNLLDSPELLEKDLLHCERLVTSHPRDNVVMISGLESHTQEINISIFVLKRPIQWDQSVNKAQIVIYWDRGKVTQNAFEFENEYVPHLLEQTFYNRAVIDELVKSPDYNRLIEIMNVCSSAVLMTSNGFR